jgi:iron(III) transport system substrate-binding protein
VSEHPPSSESRIVGVVSRDEARRVAVRSRKRRRNWLRARRAESLFLLLLLGGRAAVAQTQIDPLTYDGPDRAQQLLAGAQREGQVAFYSGMIENQALRPIALAFQKKYPSIKLTWWRADSEDIVTKIAAEMRGNNHVGDVMEGTGIGEEAIAAGLAQPFTTPALSDFPAQYRDPRHLWAPTRMSYFGTAYNTRVVLPADVPKTYDALLDPKWKGKMAWSFGPAVGAALFITNLRIAWGEDKAMAYFKKLAAQKVIDYGATARTVVDRVMAGEFVLGLNIYAHHPLISKAKGASVDTVLMDPVPSAAGTVLVPKGAPHPFAAMLLIDFLLSKEGQEIMAKSEYFPARPDVSPVAALSPVVPSRAGFHENFVSPDLFAHYSPSSAKIADEIFR